MYKFEKYRIHIFVVQGPPDPGSENMISIALDAASSPFYLGQIPYPKAQHEKTGVKDVKSSEHDKELDVVYQDPSLLHTLELLEQIFLDDIMKLKKY